MPARKHGGLARGAPPAPQTMIALLKQDRPEAQGVRFKAFKSNWAKGWASGIMKAGVKSSLLPWLVDSGRVMRDARAERA